MARATGIGGVFFRAADPEGLSAWYRQHLGVDMTSGVWMQDAGPTAFAPFRNDSDYFAADRQWMMNFRVDDLTALLSDLVAAGINAEQRTEWDGDGSYGYFARIHDPEDNPIELWEPPGSR